MGIIPRRRNNDSPVDEQRATALIVEDVVIFRETWTRLLATLNYRVASAADAESALPLIADQPLIALIDVHLPGRDGLWLIDRIRKESPTTGIVLTTGDSDVPAVTRLDPAVVAYLVKPFTNDTLKDAVDAAARWATFHRKGT